MRIVDLTRGTRMAETVREARSFGARLCGWMGKRAAEIEDGLYLAPCAWIHTFGMHFAVDAVFVDRHGAVLAVHTLAPGRVSPWVRRSAGVLELPAGTCARAGCRTGDRLAQEGGNGW